MQSVHVPLVPAFPGGQNVQLVKGEADVEPSAQVDSAEAPGPEYFPIVETSMQPFGVCKLVASNKVAPALGPILPAGHDLQY